MQNTKIGTWSLGIACIGIGVVIFLASLHAVPWSVLQYVWPLLIILFGVEILLYHTLNPGGRSEWNGLAFAGLCVLFVASVSDFVGTRAVRTFTTQILPFHTRAYMYSVAGTLTARPGITRLFVRVPNADVRVVGNRSNQLTYRGQLGVRAVSHEAGWRLLQSDWVVRAVGNELDMELIPARSTGFPLSTNLTQKGELTLTVPERFSITVRGLNGSLDIHGTKGSATASTLNGSVHISQVDGTANASTLNGQISVIDVHQGLTAHSVNGDITLRDVSGAGKVNAVNGSIQAALGLVSGDWSLTTVNGDVNCRFRPDTTGIALVATAPHVSIRGHGWHYGPTGDKTRRTAYVGPSRHHVRLQTVDGSVAANL